MERELLKEIILEQQEVIKNKEIGIERQDLSKIKEYIPLLHTILISGMRRVGKSTLLAQIIDRFYKGNIYYLNFEDERLINFEPEDFNHLYESFVELFGKQKAFFLDEVQNVKGWEMFVRRMSEAGFKFFITGSNASLLSKEIGTKLTGRYLTCELYPFSFKEFLKLKGYLLTKNALSLTAKRAEIKGLFNEYLKEGGMPEYLKFRNPEILKKVYDDILYRDIVARYDIKETKSLRELALYFLSNPGSLFSHNKLKKALGLGSVNTIKAYTEYLENSFMIFVANIFSYSLKQQFIAPKKAYCIDNRLADCISFKFSKNRGKFLENLVVTELRRRGKELYYYKTRKGLEVDILIRKGEGVEGLIQVTQSLSDVTVRQRELKSLTAAMEELGLQKGLILTQDEEEKIKLSDKVINVKPVYKWLLTV
ncbi:MAG: ATP-binding protein [bacterium]